MSTRVRGAGDLEKGVPIGLIGSRSCCIFGIINGDGDCTATGDLAACSVESSPDAAMKDSTRAFGLSHRLERARASGVTGGSGVEGGLQCRCPQSWTKQRRIRV
jgi:hypothetical protein